jgi:hypothetical protein
MLRRPSGLPFVGFVDSVVWRLPAVLTSAVLGKSRQ